MIYKNFKIHTIVRVVAIMGTMLLFFVSIYQFHLNVTPFLLGFLVIFQVIDLIRYIQKTNHYLSNFLESIRYSDFRKLLR